MFAKAPVLAWLLTAVTLVMMGLTAIEVRSQAAMPPVVRTAVVIVTIEIAAPAVATFAAQPLPTATPTATPCDPTVTGSPRFGCTGNVR